jgi:hypothetical protein
MGRSEFGVDKGFGEDFSPLPFKFFVGSFSGRRVEAQATQAELKIDIANKTAANKLDQKARITQVNAQKTAKVSALLAALDANNSVKQALEEQRNSNRSVYLPVILRGVTQSSFTMVEETGCPVQLHLSLHPEGQEQGPSGLTNLTRLADCAVRNVTVQRSACNKTGDISRTDMVVFSPSSRTTPLLSCFFFFATKIHFFATTNFPPSFSQ